jgi:hypothetical protein
VRAGRASAKLVGTVKYTIRTFWYLASKQLLVLATGNGCEMRPYLLHSPTPVKLAKFLLPNVPVQRDVVLVCLYSELYCTIIDNVGLQLRLVSRCYCCCCFCCCCCWWWCCCCCCCCWWWWWWCCRCCCGCCCCCCCC